LLDDDALGEGFIVSIVEQIERGGSALESGVVSDNGYQISAIRRRIV